MIGKKKGIVVNVYRGASKKTEVALSSGDTIADALVEAGMNLKASEIVQVNGDEVEREELDQIEATDGDRIVLVKNIQGG